MAKLPNVFKIFIRSLEIPFGTATQKVFHTEANAFCSTQENKNNNRAPCDIAKRQRKGECQFQLALCKTNSEWQQGWGEREIGMHNLLPNNKTELRAFIDHQEAVSRKEEQNDSHVTQLHLQFLSCWSTGILAS